MFYATLDEDGNVVTLSDNTADVILESNQIELKSLEYHLLSAVSGNAELGIYALGIVKRKIEKSVEAQKKSC